MIDQEELARREQFIDGFRSRREYYLTLLQKINQELSTCQEEIDQKQKRKTELLIQQQDVMESVEALDGRIADLERRLKASMG